MEKGENNPKPKWKVVPKEEKVLNVQKIFKLKKQNKHLLGKWVTIKDRNCTLSTLVPDNNSFNKETPIVAIDCEFVIGENGLKEIARISIVNYNRHILFDEVIKP